MLPYISELHFPDQLYGDINTYLIKLLQLITFKKCVKNLEKWAKSSKHKVNGSSPSKMMDKTCPPTTILIFSEAKQWRRTTSFHMLLILRFLGYIYLLHNILFLKQIYHLPMPRLDFYDPYIIFEVSSNSHSMFLSLVINQAGHFNFNSCSCVI